MANTYRRQVAKKLKETIETATDPMVIAALAGQLAKFLPKPKSPQRKRGTLVAPIKAKEPSLDELVAEMEKKRKDAQKSEANRAIV